MTHGTHNVKLITVYSVEHHLFSSASIKCFSPAVHHQFGKNGTLNTQFRIEIYI